MITTEKLKRFVSLVSFSALAVFSLAAVVGCNEIDVKDGKVPNEYLSVARQYTGVYRGKFEGRAGQIELRLEGNTAVLSYRDARGDDLLRPECGSRIGLLRTVSVSEHNGAYELKSAKFDFNPGDCWTELEGRDLHLYFSVKNGQRRVKLSMLKEITYEEDCRIESGDPRRGEVPRRVCRDIPVAAYLNGQFAR